MEFSVNVHTGFSRILGDLLSRVVEIIGLMLRKGLL